MFLRLLGLSEHLARVLFSLTTSFRRQLLIRPLHQFRSDTGLRNHSLFFISTGGGPGLVDSRGESSSRSTSVEEAPILRLSQHQASHCWLCRDFSRFYLVKAALCGRVPYR